MRGSRPYLYGTGRTTPCRAAFLISSPRVWFKFPFDRPRETLRGVFPREETLKLFTRAWFTRAWAVQELCCLSQRGRVVRDTHSPLLANLYLWFHSGIPQRVGSPAILEQLDGFPRAHAAGTQNQSARHSSATGAGHSHIAVVARGSEVQIQERHGVRLSGSRLGCRRAGNSTRVV